jgi:A/G-specific adenine glycosylase
MQVSMAIINWYNQNKRDLPWRKTNSPYHIWLSEVILQQTRIAQGLDYYLQFIEKYPEIEDLAIAPFDEVLRLWQGLGYYSRARNLHYSARMIVAKYGGRIPDNYTDLIKIKGVGPYTAAAVASIAFKQPVALVDGNVSRVLARLYSVKEPVNSGAGKAELSRLANEILDPSQPGIHNQALMEFGSMVCLPKNPLCGNCVLSEMCLAKLNHETGLYPIKERKIKLRTRYFNYLLIQYHENIFLHKRIQKDIWYLLYEFPLIETGSALSFSKLTKHPAWKLIFGNGKVSLLDGPKQYKHQLTHQTLHCFFYHVKVNVRPEFRGDEYILIPYDRMDEFAIPRAIGRYLSEQKQEGKLSK